MISYTQLFKDTSHNDFMKAVAELDHFSEDSFGANPLVACVVLGDEEKVDYLLAAGHSPTIGTRLATPVSSAITSERNNSAKILGKLLSAANGQILEREYEYSPEIRTTLINGCIEHENIECMKLLLAYGCDPYLVDEDCQNAFDLAQEMENIEALEILKGLKNS